MIYDVNGQLYRSFLVAGVRCSSARAHQGRARVSDIHPSLVLPSGQQGRRKVYGAAEAAQGQGEREQAGLQRIAMEASTQ
jgi:hypothetical protein